MSNYSAAWVLHHKLLHAMAEADSKRPLQGEVVLNVVQLEGEQPGKPGRGSLNKVPVIAAVSLNADGRPMYMKATAISGFTAEAINSWAKAQLVPGSAHSHVVIGQRKPGELPQFAWVNGRPEDQDQWSPQALPLHKVREPVLGRLRKSLQSPV